MIRAESIKDGVSRGDEGQVRMEPFASYPEQGRKPLGRPRDLTGARRSGYGLSLQRMTGQSACAYCGLSLVDTYEHWLLMPVDHVVP